MLIKTYEVAVANQPFLFDETVACAQYLLEHDGAWDSVTQAVQEGTLLNNHSVTTAKTYLRAIRFRLENVPPELLAMLTAQDDTLSCLTLFYILLQRNRLLRELMEELVRDVMLAGEEEIAKQEIEDFLAFKRSQSQVLSEWSDTTWRKFWGNTLKSVIETQMLQGSDPLLLYLCPVPSPLRDWLLAHDEAVYLQLMLDVDAWH
ncbi:MAG: BrxA family protein [Candidatus Sericytochromatia bacterium]